jgi:hypothetical protein
MGGRAVSSNNAGLFKLWREDNATQDVKFLLFFSKELMANLIQMHSLPYVLLSV